MDIKVTELKKYMSTKTDKELKDEIMDLFKLSREVKEYYFLKLKPGSEKELMEKYKKIIENEFFPLRGNKFPDYKVLKKAVDDFKKVSRNPVYLADLMMIYVENGVEFTNTYGDIDERFYKNIAGMYQKAIAVILENDLESEFRERCRKAMEESSNIGWGFGIFMEDYYFNSIGIDDEDEEE